MQETPYRNYLTWIEKRRRAARIARLTNYAVEQFAQLSYRSSLPEVLLGRGILKTCSKCTGEHPCRSAISKKLLCNFNEIALWHGCFPVNLLHILRTPFPKNISEELLLFLVKNKRRNIQTINS